MAMTGYYKTLVRPRVHKPLSMLKYDPVGTCVDLDSQGQSLHGERKTAADLVWE